MIVSNFLNNRQVPKIHYGFQVVAFVSCDTMYPYIDEYFDNLPKKYFKEEKHLKSK